MGKPLTYDSLTLTYDNGAQISVFNALDSLLHAGLSRPCTLPWSKHTNTSQFKNLVLGTTFSQFLTASSDPRLYHTEVAGREVMQRYHSADADDKAEVSGRTSCSSCRCSSVVQSHRLLDTVSRRVYIVNCCHRHSVPPHRPYAPLVTLADYCRALQPVPA